MTTQNGKTGTLIFIACIVVIVIFIFFQKFSKVERVPDELKVSKFSEVKIDATTLQKIKEEEEKRKEDVKQTIKNNLSYKILEVSNDKYKCTSFVRLTKKEKYSDLAEIATKIKNELKCKINRVHLFFLLPDMQLNSGAWARADFNPHLNIVYLGRSVEEDEHIKKAVVNIEDYIGIWQDPDGKGDIAVRIRKDPRHGYIRELIELSNPKPDDVFFDKLKLVRKNGKTIFIELENDFGEYYVLEPNEDLSVYDNEGYITTYRKLIFNGI